MSDYRLRVTPPSGLVRPLRVGSPGGPTRHQAEGLAWRWVARGWYVPSSVDADVPEQRILEASVLLPPDGAVTGWAALRLHGAGFFDGRIASRVLPVPLALGETAQIRPRSGVRLHYERLPENELREVAGIPCTSVHRALFDEMRQRPLRAAVIAMDLAAAAELTSVERQRSFVEGHLGYRRSARALRALDLASDASKSPGETWLRLAWTLDAGQDLPLVNTEVFDRQGALLGVPDLFDPIAGVAGEYDGSPHRTARQHSADLEREHRFRDAGIEFVRVAGPDLRHPERVVERIRSAHRRAEQRAHVGGWTLDPPEDWPVGLGLEDRLAWLDMLAEQERQIQEGVSRRTTGG